MTYLLIQEELVKNLININDATIIGVLLCIIALLVYYVNKKDNLISELNGYIRLQDKSTLEILSELTKALKDRQEMDREVKDGVKDIHFTVKDNNSALTSLNAMIQNKLMNMHDGK